MAKELHFETQKLQKSLRYGGREVLRTVAQLPVGERAMEVHLRAMVQALVEYAARELYPTASAELQAAVDAGCGYRFLPHVYHIGVDARPARGCIRVVLTVRHTQGELCHAQRVLEMRWSPDGVYQYGGRAGKGRTSVREV